ncbi:hypothetical protein BWO91_00565 [Plantibacter flavus]|nr:hypothetical protein BWO91_00565 [Plantibacter flavus]
MYTVFRADPALVDSNYLIRFLKSPQALKAYERLGQGAVHRRKSISLASLGTLPLPLPPLDEQRRIAAILDQADENLGKQREAIGLLDGLVDSTFQSVIMSSDGPVVTIGDLALSSQYGTAQRAGAAGAFPILRMGNITDAGRIDVRDLKYIDLETNAVDRYTVRRGDLLFNRTNSLEKVGKAAVARSAEQFAFAGYLVRVRFPDAATAEYVSAYLRTPAGLALRRGSAKAAVNQANINAKEFLRFSIPAPTSYGMQQLERVLQHVELERSKHLAALADLETLFASLQARAFRGEL